TLIRQRTHFHPEDAVARGLLVVREVGEFLRLTRREHFLEDLRPPCSDGLREDFSQRLPVKSLNRTAREFFDGRVRRDEPERVWVFRIFQAPDGDANRHLADEAFVQFDGLPHGQPLGWRNPIDTPWI